MVLNRSGRRAILIGRSRKGVGRWQRPRRGLARKPWQLLRGARPLPWKPAGGDFSKAAPGSRCPAAGRGLPAPRAGAPAARGLGRLTPRDGPFPACGDLGGAAQGWAPAVVLPRRWALFKVRGEGKQQFPKCGSPLSLSSQLDLFNF